MAQLSRNTGIILLLISALVFSTAGLFTKGVAAGASEVIFWRGVFAAPKFRPLRLRHAIWTASVFLK